MHGPSEPEIFFDKHTLLVDAAVVEDQNLICTRHHRQLIVLYSVESHRSEFQATIVEGLGGIGNTSAMDFAISVIEAMPQKPSVIESS